MDRVILQKTRIIYPEGVSKGKKVDKVTECVSNSSVK